MPTATLTYQLPEETVEHEYALRGVDYYLALEDLDAYLRKQIKYESLNGTRREIYEEIRALLCKIREERDVL